MTSKAAKISILGPLFCISSVIFACEPRYQSLDIRQLSTPPQPFTTQIRNDRIIIPEGVATLISAVPTSKNSEEYQTPTHLELWSEQPNLFLVQPTASRHEFVLIGVAQGQTCMPVEIDDVEEECIPVEVTSPIGTAKF